MISSVVYFLCGFTSGTCAWLLIRQYRRRFTRLLLWSSFSFAVFALGNVMVFIDYVVVPHVDLSGVRAAVSLVGAALMVFGLIWEVQ